MHIRKLLALVLCACLILGLVPAVSAAGETLTPALTGNTGAVITCSTTPLSAEVDNNDLAIVEIRGNEVRVIAKDNAVGVARLTVQTSSGYHIFDIPIGYTTFVFNGNTLTVIPGSSSNYEVTGINAAAEEYVVGDATYPLPYTTDANGYQVFENTSTYKLNVGLKKNGGTYVFTGTGTDSSIAVKKAAVNPTTILLAGLDLTSSFTAPIAIKKESTTTATITALGGFTNTLTDNAFNNADTYGPTDEGGNGSNAEYAESAVIKGKSNSNVTVNGAGTLNLVCNTKNALKVGEYGSLTIDELTLNVTSAKNGISSDNTLTINGGNLTVTTSDGDCIRSDPDAVDATAGCAGNIVINGGSFTLQAASDGIQAAQDLTVNGGSFNIRTGSGYNDSSFNKDTMSCKGLKASTNATDSSTGTTTEEATNHLTVNGGTFTFNTPDDAIHSDAYVVITGGEFSIQTGDDGVHGEIQADFGVQNAPDCKIHMTVSASYEGLEAKDVYIRSGCYDVTASDDGINAAGGSSNGSDPSPWGPGGPGGGGTAGDYTLAISGGNVNVNCNGDGLDSNGALNITGGQSIVWAQAPNGDNSPLDCDGTMTVNGGTVFGGGTNPMNENPSTSTSQPYVLYGGSSGGWGGGSSSTISSGRTVVVKNASSQTVFSIKAPKNINYAIYSSPSMSSSSGWSITSDTSTPTVTRYWAEHSYGSYVQTQAPTCTVPGVKTATCSVCGGTQTQEVAATGHSWSYVTIAPTATLEGYDLYTCATCGGQYRTNFVDPLNGPNPCQNGHTWDAGVVTVQPTCTEDGVTTYTCTVCGETNVLASPAALGHDFNETTGVCNRCGAEAFRITYVCVGGVSVTAFPSQDLTTGGVANATTVFVRNSGGGIDISGSGQANFLAVLEEGYGVASVEVTPAGSYNAIKYPTDIGVEHAYRVTKINQDVTITITAEEGLCEHEFDEDGFCIHCGIEAPKAVFVTDGHAVVTAYPTQDLTTGGVVNPTVAIARNSDTGEVDINGNGQVNFTVAPNPGYDVESITAEPTSAYNKFKDNLDGSYRLTKVNATVTVTITTVPNGQPTGSTVSLIASGVSQGSLVAQDGETVTLPTTVTVNPADWTFIGWVGQQLEETTSAPTFYAPGASYTVTGDATLYALYTRTEGSGATVYELVETAPADWSGNYVITYNTDTSLYALTGMSGGASGTQIESPSNATAYASTGMTLNGTTLSNVANAYLFTLAPSGSYYSVKSVSTGSYLGAMSTNFYLAAYSTLNTSYCLWTPGYYTANASSLYNANTSTNYPLLSFSTSSSYFWTGSVSNQGTTAQNVRFWKETASGTSYYTTSPIADPGTDWTVTFTTPAGVTAPAAMTINSLTGDTLPTAGAPEGYTFLGWVTEDYDNVTTQPNQILTGLYKPTADVTLKALYTYNVTGEAALTLTQMSTSDTLADGDKIVITAYGTGYGLYQQTANNNYAAYYVFTDDAETIAADEKNWFTVTAASGGWYLGDDTNGYLYNNTSNYLYVNANKSVWTLTTLNGYLALMTNGRYLSCRTDLTTGNANLWRMGGTAGTSGVCTLVIYKLTEGASTTAYYTTIINGEHEHTPAEPVVENEVPATCTAAGSYDSVVYCSDCGEELSRETVTVPALGHDYVAVVTPPTATEQGYTTHICSRCGDSYVDSWTDPTGPVEPIETDALHIYSSISVGTDMVVTFTARKNDLTDYNNFWIEVVKKNPDGDVTYTYNPEDMNEGSSTWTVQFKNIFAKEMGLDVEARLYAENAAGQVYMSPVRNANIRDYLGGRLIATNNSVEQRVLAADMLNYGAAAQMFTDFQTDHLVNEELSAEQLAKLEEYQTTELPTVNKTNYNTRPEGQSNILFTSVTLGNEVLLNLTIRLAEGTEGVQVLVKNHATGAVVTTLDTTFLGSTFNATFNGIGADAMRTEFDLVTIVNGVETGNIRTWSVEAYVGEIRTEGIALKVAMGNALLTYGDSAAAYFAAQ